MKLYSDLARYPGNESLFDAVEMSIISTIYGLPLHLHAQGLRGTGKTTIFRSAAQIMPKITRVKGCLYNCDPDHPHCPKHKDLTSGQIEELGREEIPMPFLEISHSAKIGTVAGSIDLAKITDPTHPEAALLPGIIPQAHRGIIFIDEINRLADTSPEITDILLDVMGTKPGRVQIEETGLASVEVPVQVSVWAASNPDEDPGPLSDVRKQLSDRFDLVLDMGRPDKVDAVAGILRQHRKGRAHSVSRALFVDRRNAQLTKEILSAAARLEGVWVPEFFENLLAELYVKFNIESLRAIEALQQAAQLRAALSGRQHTKISDILAIAPLALSHRVELERLQEILEYLKDDRFTSEKPEDSGNKPEQTSSLARIFGGKKSHPTKQELQLPLADKASPLSELSAEEAVSTEADL